MKKTKPEYYSPVENLLDLIYEHYTEKEHWGRKNIGVRPYEIHIKKIKQNQKFYKRNIKYLVKAYHK